jgi:tight adherence protein C
MLTHHLLLASACLLFGSATAMLVLVAYRLLEAQPADTISGGTSIRRQFRRSLALQRSSAYRFTLPFVGLITPLTRRLSLEPLLNYVRDPYAQAGYPGGFEDDEVVALGLLIGVGVSIFVGVSATIFGGFALTFVGLLGMPIGFLLLVTSLKNEAKRREIAILQAMPYMLDLLVLMLRGGTSVSIALQRVNEDFKNHPLGDELGQVLAEIEVGSNRAAAFTRLAERLKIQDLSALADTIVQSEELGWPLAETLERLSDRLAAERILRAQSRAGAAGVLVMLPSTLVLVSAVLMLFGPFVTRLLIRGLGIK